jgi:cytochrome c
MSDLGFNKIAACVLGTGLALIGLNEASHAFFHEPHHEKPGYFIDVPETPAAGAAVAVAEGPRDYNKLITAASAENGKTVSVKCQQCHKFVAGAESTGPSLFNILGKDIASEPGFKYSTGTGSMSVQEGTWTYEKFDHYIESPKRNVPGTAMNFIGIKKQTDRADLMAYLRTLGNPPPLPEPLPEQPAAPPADGAAPPADGAAPAGATPATPGATPAPGAPAPAGATPAAPTPATPAPAAPKPATPGQH